MAERLGGWRFIAMERVFGLQNVSEKLKSRQAVNYINCFLVNILVLLDLADGCFKANCLLICGFKLFIRAIINLVTRLIEAYFCGRRNFRKKAALDALSTLLTHYLPWPLFFQNPCFFLMTCLVRVKAGQQINHYCLTRRRSSA